MTPLHHFGNALRDVLLLIPLPVVRLLFLALPIVLFVWVLRLPTSATARPDAPSRWDENLKLWACVALLVQVVIYVLL